MNRIYIFDK